MADFIAESPATWTVPDDVRRREEAKAAPVAVPALTVDPKRAARLLAAWKAGRPWGAE